MVFDWATTGPYEGHTVTFIETYRGYDIYFLTGPGGLYGFVDPDGNELSTWASTLEAARSFIDGWIGEPEPEPEPLGVTLIAVVTPPLAGFLVQLWWYAPHGEWLFIEPGTTDAEGKKTWLYYFASYPQTVRIHLPAGQVIDDVEYGGDTSIDATIQDGSEWGFFLYPQQVEPEPPPEPDPWEKEYVETYRGVEIYRYLVSGWYSFSFLTVGYNVPPPIEDVRTAIDEAIATAKEPYIVEYYRDIAIWWMPNLNRFWADIEPGYWAEGLTLEAVRTRIDEILDFIENPPLDPMSLLAQLLSQVVSWVDTNMPTWLQPVYNWIDTGLGDAKLAWESLVGDATALITKFSGDLTNLATTVGDRWDTFTTLTLPSIWDTITTQAANLQGAIDLKGTELEASMDSKLVDFTTWILGLFELLDPHAFLKDPLGFIKGAFNIFIDPWAEGIVKSFWEGFEEGQTTG